MSYPKLSLIRPSVRRRLRRGGDLALYRATPEAIVCLPIPALFLGSAAPDPAGASSVVWRDGERSGLSSANPRLVAIDHTFAQ